MAANATANRDMTVKATIKILGLILVIGVLAFPDTSRAFSCPVDTATCNGNLYQVMLTPTGVNTWEANIQILITDDYVGTFGSDGVHAIQIKGFGTNVVVDPTSVAGPGGLTWAYFPNELSDNGCDGGTMGVQRACLATTTFPGATFNSGDILQWTFDFTADSVNETAELKYLYLADWDCHGRSNNCGYFKVGDLGSFTIGVPEPSTVALMGLALLLLGALGMSRRWNLFMPSRGKAPLPTR